MLTIGGLFDGIGLLAYGLHLAGLEHRWLCEVDPWRRSILKRRFPGVPILHDVRDAGAVRCERVDVIAGGFPCKGASTAGKREGFGHPETVLWREMFRAVRELEPRFVVVENVANLLVIHDGAVWGEVVGDLASLGFDIEWDCLPAAAVGAPHRRDRVFAVATHPLRSGLEGAGLRGPVADGVGAVADAEGAGGQAARPGREALVGVGTDGGRATPDSARHAEGGPGSQAGADGERAGTGADASADTSRRRRIEQPTEHRAESERPKSDLERHGVQVEWGSYGPAIWRWEAVHGPSPAPLVSRVRGMDARSTARVERSRLSALGDGVQVQIGQIVGEYIVAYEEGRVAA